MTGSRQLAAILMAALLILSGCGAAFDAAGYLTGVLDNIYHGDSSVYLKYVDITEEEAKEEYELGISAETDFFLQYYGLSNVSDAVRKEIGDMYRRLYEYSSFKVAQSAESGEDFVVEVTVYPITVFQESREEIRAAVEQFVEKGDPDSYTDEQALHDRLAKLVVAVIEDELANMENGKGKTVKITVRKDSDELFTPDADAMDALDQLIISY